MGEEKEFKVATRESHLGRRERNVKRKLPSEWGSELDVETPDLSHGSVRSTTQNRPGNENSTLSAFLHAFPSLRRNSGQIAWRVHYFMRMPGLQIIFLPFHFPLRQGCVPVWGIPTLR